MNKLSFIPNYTINVTLGVYTEQVLVYLSDTIPPRRIQGVGIRILQRRILVNITLQDKHIYTCNKSSPYWPFKGLCTICSWSYDMKTC